MTIERPTFLNFARLRFPVGSVASIGHRISGVLLFLTLPFAVWALERSLRSERPLDLNGGPLARLAFFVLAWAAAHHLFAGIRHLLSDANIGSSLQASRASAWAALIGAVAVASAVLVLP
ncbi:MAG TPA: succinate dehydrogenase, cytochrome b556 subunit [Burkholderiales bacterium]|nr:succinate dehydrogenase, cytochrome b556 subunit [Burkholderiales bacterium]